MASVFTYDPDPPRVSSPWLQPEEPSKANGRVTPAQTGPEPGHLSEYGVTKLEAEPQQGPTEYKLHLLLRPRRAFTSMSTTTQASGSHSVRANEFRSSKPPTPSNGVKSTWNKPQKPESEHCSNKSASSLAACPSPGTPSQSRQQRLQNLTTQLLWRLQQSSPHHASSSRELMMPRLPDDNVDLTSPVKLGKLVPGLEESRGALYEIGVSDDGTLIGLTKDEMDESIATLRVMAASLGCSVEVLRMVIVGECEWLESTELVDDPVQRPAEVTQQGKLWVAEAFVTPNLGFANDGANPKPSDSGAATAVPSRGSSFTPQLRVTFTGPTTSGKSSLLGTLSTGTLDNGRGKSRLSLLKHRHEVVSGVTSSIAQELVGYRDDVILNYSQANIESWVDIHNRAEEGGRLVFVSDSAGHPRYRRTVLRGLMNWAPHWSILCIAADDSDSAPSSFGATSTAQDVLGATAAGIDLVRAHLTLSLKLEVPLAIVMTKLDLASKVSLQKTMAKILTVIKDAGRAPKILQPGPRPHDTKLHEELEEVPKEDSARIQQVLGSITEDGDFSQVVPILFTSAVDGRGIGLVHALLENLPLPPTPTSRDFVGMALNPEQPKCLFHIDDTFNLSASYCSLSELAGSGSDQGVVVSGHLRFGRLSVGDKIVIGPFPSEEDNPHGSTPEDRPSPGSYGLSISHPSSAELVRIAMKNAVSASAIAGEWHNAQIVSIRNLRLPVLSLESGQAGSVGLVLENCRSEQTTTASNVPRIRRGMVLAIPSKHMADTGLSLQAASGFTAIFNDPDAMALGLGSFVNVYVASVRTAARILRVSRQVRDWKPENTATDYIDDIFSLNEESEVAKGNHAQDGVHEIEVSLELLHNREWIEMGSRVILLEGGSQDRSGLEGFVGRVVEIVD